MWNHVPNSFCWMSHDLKIKCGWCKFRPVLRHHRDATNFLETFGALYKQLSKENGITPPRKIRVKGLSNIIPIWRLNCNWFFVFFAAARELKLWLYTATYKLCNGCYYNQSSPVQHECLMPEDEERIRLCIETALDMVDWKKVSQDWWQHLTIAHQICCNPQCNDINWFCHVFGDMDMKEKFIAVLQNQSECVNSVWMKSNQWMSTKLNPWEWMMWIC